MKNVAVPKPFISLLVVGLMLSTVFAPIARHLHLPDVLTGFVIGFGISLELIAVFFIIRQKKMNASKHS